jgi:hypothetical protein
MFERQIPLFNPDIGVGAGFKPGRPPQGGIQIFVPKCPWPGSDKRSPVFKLQFPENGKAA